MIRHYAIKPKVSIRHYLLKHLSLVGRTGSKICPSSGFYTRHRWDYGLYFTHCTVKSLKALKVILACIVFGFNAKLENANFDAFSCRFLYLFNCALSLWLC